MANQASRTQMMRALLRLRELILSGEFAPGERMSRAAARGAARRVAHAAAARACQARARGPAAQPLGRRLRGAGVHAGRHPRRDRAARRARGHGGAIRRRARRHAPRLRALRAINAEIEPLLHRADYESFEAYVDSTSASMRACSRSPAAPCSSARSRGSCRCRSPASSAMVLTEAELPESREILIDRPPPPPGADRGDRAPPERARRGSGPRARADRADQPGDRPAPPRDARAAARARRCSRCPGGARDRQRASPPASPIRSRSAPRRGSLPHPGGRRPRAEG